MSPAATASSAPVIKESNVVPPVDMLARRTKFEGAWKLIRDELLEHFGKEGMPKEATEWYQRVSCGSILQRLLKTTAEYACWIGLHQSNQPLILSFFR